MELVPWLECLDRLAATPQQAAALLHDAVAILQARAAYLAAHIRVCVRVREPRDVDLVLGQGCSRPAGTRTSSTRPANS